VLVLAPLYKASAEVVNDKRQKETSHEDGSRSAFILKFAETRIAEHQVCVGEEMDESSRDDNTCAKLFEYDKDDVVLRDEVEPGGEDRKEYSCTTGDQDDKEQPNAQRDVVVAIWSVAVPLFCAATNAMAGGFNQHLIGIDSTTVILTGYPHDRDNVLQSQRALPKHVRRCACAHHLHSPQSQQGFARPRRHCQHSI
jgi:hypothetical protein